MQYPRAAHCPAHGLCWTLGLHGLLRRWAKGWRPCEDPWGKGSWHPLLASPRLKGTTGQHCGQYRVMLNFTQMSSKLDIGPPSILAACPSGKSVKILKASGQDCKYVCPAEALLAKKNNHVLFGIPAVSTAVIRVMPCTYCTAGPSMIGLTDRKSQPPRGSK